MAAFMTAERRAGGEPHLVLRLLQETDEAGAIAAHEELIAEGFDFLLGWDASLSWHDYVAQLENERRGRDLAPGRVPATFLVAEVDGHLVGRVSIRHSLNDYLARFGGHIGYGVHPLYRSRGFATTMLRQSLVIAVGLIDQNQVLLTCDDTNVASQRVIQACGGELADTVTDPIEGTMKQRYWIKLPID